MRAAHTHTPTHKPPLTCRAMVGAMLGQLSQALKVLLAVVTGEDGLVVEVVVTDVIIMAGHALFPVLHRPAPLLGIRLLLLSRNI